MFQWEHPIRAICVRCLMMTSIVMSGCQFVGRETAWDSATPQWHRAANEQFSQKSVNFQRVEPTRLPAVASADQPQLDFVVQQTSYQESEKISADGGDAAEETTSTVAEVESVSSESDSEDLMPPDKLSPDPMAMASEDDHYPIDLANALALGGANHLQVRLARERVIEAQANLLRAEVMWLPSLRFGLGWNKHDGRLQEIEGNVLEINRNSLFVGGGAGLGTASLAGGGNGPSRLAVNLSLADAIFEQKVAQCLLRAEQSARRGTLNDSLLEITDAYFDLFEAYGAHANASVGLNSATEMVRLTSAFAEAGMGNQSEVDRAQAEQAHWIQEVEDARRRMANRSAELVRLLRLDPHLKLFPVEDKIAPVHILDPTSPIEVLLNQGLSRRPEISQQRSLVLASQQRWYEEKWRPWLPHVQAGASAGTFGGGPSSHFTNQAGRSDVDLLAVWELENAGLGNRAHRNRRASQLRQSRFQVQSVLDQVTAEIIQAQNDLTSYYKQLETAQQNIKSATDSYRRNLERVTEGEGLPLELQQAIRARVGALVAYTRAASAYNRSQFHLLRAIGQSPSIAP